MRGWSLVSVGSVAAVVAVTGCADPYLGRTDPVADCVDTKVIPVPSPGAFDILFVVDDSASMAGEQAALAANAPSFIGVLQTVEGGLPDVHIGVVSTDVGAAGMTGVPGCTGHGDDGNLLVPAACTGLDGWFISDGIDGHGQRIKNYTGELAPLFACMVQLGTDGCGFEMPLEAAYRALQPGKNPGFLRPDAYLLVVFITDEDDCSTAAGSMFGDPTAGLASPLGPRTSYRCFEFGVTCDDGPADPRAFGTRTGCRANPQSPYLYELDRYVDFLKGLKEDPSMVIVAGVVGKDDERHTVVVGPDPAHPAYPRVEPSCFQADSGDPDDGAVPPVRLAEFLRSFPNRNTVTSICSATFQDALQNVAVGGWAIGKPCFPRRLRDRDPEAPGPQYECSVVDVRQLHGHRREETVIPACSKGDGARPCWRILPDPQQCPDAPEQLALDVERGDGSVRSGTFLHVQCVTD